MSTIVTLLVTALVSLTSAEPAALTMAVQDEPDFSGEWLLDSAVQANVDAPLSLSVRQNLVTTTRSGEPIGDIWIERRFRNRVHSVALPIGVVVGKIAPLGRPYLPREERGALWEGSTLILLVAIYHSHTKETGRWHESREAWSLDTGGRLHVVATEDSSDDPSTTHKIVYRKAH